MKSDNLANVRKYSASHRIRSYGEGEEGEEELRRQESLPSTLRRIQALSSWHAQLCLQYLP